MTVANAPIGWMPESTDATFIASAAVVKGAVCWVTTKFALTTGNAPGIPGVTVAGAINTENKANQNAVFAVALEPVAANAKGRFRVRGLVQALVEKDQVDIAKNNELVACGTETDNTFCMTLASDLDAGSATTQASSRKILALSEEAYTSTTAGLVWVLFNGAEGFGTHVGTTPA